MGLSGVSRSKLPRTDCAGRFHSKMPGSGLTYDELVKLKPIRAGTGSPQSVLQTLGAGAALG